MPHECFDSVIALISGMLWILSLTSVMLNISLVKDSTVNL